MRQLPNHPSLRHLRNEAKQLLKAHGRADAAVCPTLRRLRRFEGASDGQILAAPLRLTDVQYALAMEYGFASWRAMCDRVEGMPAEDAAYQELLGRAREVLTRKGPTQDHMHSDHHRDLIGTVNELLDGERAGLRVAVDLARSPQARLRRQAAFLLCRSGDPAGLAELLRLMGDLSYEVRVTAVRWFAAAINPNGQRDVRFADTAAASVPLEVRHLLPLVDDPHVRVRWYAVRSLRAYVQSGDATITKALRHALGDRVHKVAHEAARVLEIACPGCGAVPRHTLVPELR